MWCVNHALHDAHIVCALTKVGTVLNTVCPLCSLFSGSQRVKDVRGDNYKETSLDAVHSYNSINHLQFVVNDKRKSLFSVLNYSKYKVTLATQKLMLTSWLHYSHACLSSVVSVMCSGCLLGIIVCVELGSVYFTTPLLLLLSLFVCETKPLGIFVFIVDVRHFDNITRMRETGNDQ